MSFSVAECFSRDCCSFLYSSFTFMAIRRAYNRRLLTSSRYSGVFFSAISSVISVSFKNLFLDSAASINSDTVRKQTENAVMIAGAALRRWTPI